MLEIRRSLREKDAGYAEMRSQERDDEQAKRAGRKHGTNKQNE